jgi:tetratricopeptide (TPR) repeat protein
VAFKNDKMKNLLTLLTIALFMCTACLSQNKIDKLGSKGVTLFQNGAYKEALKKFNEIIKLDSLNSEAYMRKADCLDILGDTQNSIINYSRSIELDPKNKIALYNRALTYEKIGNIENAILDYNSAVESDPKNESELNNKLILLNLGILYGQMNQLDKAIDAFKQTIKIDSNYADAYHNLGYAYQLKGDHAKAIECFVIAIRLNPNEIEYKRSKERSMKLKE